MIGGGTITTDTLAGIARTADTMNISVVVSESGLVFRLTHEHRSIVSSLSWVQLSCATDPRGLCAFEMGHMHRAVRA